MILVLLFFLVWRGLARTQVPTITNYTVELSTFGIIAEVSRIWVQWNSLALEEAPFYVSFIYLLSYKRTYINNHKELTEQPSMAVKNFEKTLLLLERKYPSPRPTKVWKSTRRVERIFWNQQRQCECTCVSQGETKVKVVVLD